MREADNIAAVARLAPDMMGFIFWESSPRNACHTPPGMLETLPPATRRVGVFVDAAHEAILSTARRYGLHFVQLHGTETPDECHALQREGLGVIKAFGIATADDVARIPAYEGSCDFYVFDTRLPDASHGGIHGGSGVKFDHTLLAAYRGSTPYLLSGGLAPGDAEHLSATCRPLCAGFDINSRFETSPGMKDPAAIEKFIRTVKKYRQ